MTGSPACFNWFILGIFGGPKCGAQRPRNGPRFAHLGILHSNMSHRGEEQVSHYQRFKRFVLLGLHLACTISLAMPSKLPSKQSHLDWFTSGLYAPQDPQNFPRRLSGTIMKTCNACSSDNTSKTQTGKQTQQPTKPNKQQEKIQGRYMYRYIT